MCLRKNLKTAIHSGTNALGLITIHRDSEKLSPRLEYSDAGRHLKAITKQAMEKSGHYTALVVNVVDGKRQYFFTDSAGVREHFEKSPALQDILRYLESEDLSDPISLDEMECLYQFDQGSHIYASFLEAILQGSPRKHSPRGEQVAGHSYGRYAAAAVLIYLAYSYLISSKTERPLQQAQIK